jgi:hypothetical protein
LGVLTIVAVAACASGVLRPEHWLTWRIEDFRSAQASDDVLWTYSLVLENRGRLAVQIVRGFATTVIGSAQASPEQMITSATISSGELLRVPHAVLIRGSDFNLTDRTATRVVKWQFWTKYADGHSEILHADVRP